MDFGVSSASRKRARLAASLQDIATQVQEAGRALRQARHQKRRREVGKTGCRRKQQLMLLRLVKGFLPNEALPLCIAKLVLPRVVWALCGHTDAGAQTKLLEQLLDQHSIIAAAERIGSTPCEPQNMKMIKKAKRLATEQQMFSHVMHMNRNGVTPKRADLVTFMSRAWPKTGDMSDELPKTIALNKRSTNKWFQRFRRLWHVSFSRLHVREPMSDEVKALKVCTAGPKLEPKWVQNLVPKWGPDLVPL